jgi:hypothetical protein
MHGVEELRDSARRGNARMVYNDQRPMKEQEAVEMADTYGVGPVVSGDPEGRGDAADQWLQDQNDNEVASQVASGMGRSF